MKIWKPVRFAPAVALALVTLWPNYAAGQQPIVDVSELQIPNTASVGGQPAALRGSREVAVWVSLEDAALVRVAGRDARTRRVARTAAQQRAHLAELQRKQETFVGQASRLGGRELARVQKADNAVAIAIDASRILELARLPGVRSITPVIDFEMDLSQTVPKIGAAAVQALGFDGTGVRVAVLDSGIDYTHRNLGGPGVTKAFERAYGENLKPKHPRNRHINNEWEEQPLFPTAKVVGGYDFVGETWPAGPLAPDPNPIDIAGHGTAVADIIAGRSADGSHKGVAPGASLYAVKVCASFSSSCSGIAILQGLDWAADPNGDGNVDDMVDVVNLSLGASYGQKQNPTVEATANLVAAGVVVVASAGNSGDKPYVLGSPASTPGVIAVAQSQVPSAFVIPLTINSPNSIKGRYTNTATIEWAPITGNGFTGDVAFVGRGCPAGSPAPVPEGGDPYLADPSGKVALIDRGACNVSAKIDRATKAGAIGVLIGLVAPGDAISFSQGDGDTFAPSLVITQNTSNLIKSELGKPVPVNVTVTPHDTVSLDNSVVSSSSRGPDFSDNAIKPDVAAPGASIAAVAGSGSLEARFGGTSGAAPVVSGAAALLLHANPGRTPAEIKALLMNRAEANIHINPATQPGVLAPITRIGGGEVRVDRALAGDTAAWEAETLIASLSFGYHRLLATPQSLVKNVVVRNYSQAAKTYNISASFRYASDASAGVSLNVPPNISVPPNSTATFQVMLNIPNPAALPTWPLNGGQFGGSGARLTAAEFDGYITIADGSSSLRLPWQALPHKAANVTPATTEVTLVGGSGSTMVSNLNAARTGRVDIFALTGTSPQSETPPPGLGDGAALIDIKSVGVRPVQIGADANGNPLFGLQFAIDTFGRRTHPNYPAEFDIYIDADRNGTADYVVFNMENGGFAATGQNVVGVFNIATGTTSTSFFFADADLNSSNIILTAALADLGLTLDKQFDFQVFAFDNYFTGALTDAVGPMTHRLDRPRYNATMTPSTTVAVGGMATLNVVAVAGGDTASPSQSGVLLLYRDALAERESDAIKVSAAPVMTP
jgi:subtilisin family serine protease